MSGVETLPCRLLSRQWRDTPSGVEITLWGVSRDGPVKVLLETEAVMFVPRRTPAGLTEAGRRAAVDLRSLEGEDVDAVYFREQRALLETRGVLRAARFDVFESDLKPSDRFVMERFVTGSFEIAGRPARAGGGTGGGPGITLVRGGRVRGLSEPPELRLSICSLDLETDGPHGALLSFAIVFRGKGASEPRVERVVVAGRAPPGFAEPNVSFVPHEKALVMALLASVRDLDPDLLVGWNVIEYDLSVLEARCAELGIPFALGRNGERARILHGDRGQVSIARIPGRVVLDGIATLKNATWSFERYTLEHVARALLGRGKLAPAASTKRERIEEIRRMAREDPGALAAYNLEDARLVAEIFEAADLVGFACARADLVGLPLDRQGGSVAAFDHLYLPRLHRAGFVAPDVSEAAPGEPSPGGEVFEGVAGLHRDVLSFDFRSLYPSIIRTFLIDPLGLHLGRLEKDAAPDDFVDGFDGARFARTGAILPTIIEKLTTARKEAIAHGNEALSRAIKIQMNSFYGVLGTPGCRFFDPRLASSITRRGHQIIRLARERFEARGFTVLYGDTDSLFVAARSTGSAGVESLLELGRALARDVNEEIRHKIESDHRLESALELRFDTLFVRFLIPTVRSGDAGSKKKYAGLVAAPRPGSEAALELVVKGLEAVRTDWTPLARRAQRELLRRVFRDEPWEAWLRSLRKDLLAGSLDDELVYRKRLRRDLDAYGAAPAHVKAARLASEQTGEADAGGRDEIEYLVTKRGPVPKDVVSRAAIDYEHYLEKQLAPACDVVLTVLGTSFQEVAGAQLGLFA